MSLVKIFIGFFEINLRTFFEVNTIAFLSSVKPNKKSPNKTNKRSICKQLYKEETFINYAVTKVFAHPIILFPYFSFLTQTVKRGHETNRT